MTWFRRFLCNVMGWHQESSIVEYTGGDNMVTRCKHCGRRLLWSSQGWFEADVREEDHDD